MSQTAGNIYRYIRKMHVGGHMSNTIFRRCARVKIYRLDPCIIRFIELGMSVCPSDLHFSG